MQSRRLLATLDTKAACWLMVSLLSTSTPRSLSLHQSLPSLYWCRTYFSLWEGLPFPFVKIPEVPVPQHAEVYLDGRTPFFSINHFSQFCVLSNLLRVPYAPLTMLSIELWNHLRSYTLTATHTVLSPCISCVSLFPCNKGTSLQEVHASSRIVDVSCVHPSVGSDRGEESKVNSQGTAEHRCPSTGHSPPPRPRHKCQNETSSSLIL